MTIDKILIIIPIIGALFAVFTFFKGIFEYLKQSSLKRAEYFFTIRKKFKENKVFMKICDLLEIDDEEIKNVDDADKKSFLGFYEEIAMMMNSNIIREEIVLYMFGYYAIKCWECNYFWNKNISRDDPYWCLFKEFALTLQKGEKRLLSNRFKVAKLKFSLFI